MTELEKAVIHKVSRMIRPKETWCGKEKKSIKLWTDVNDNVTCKSCLSSMDAVKKSFYYIPLGRK